MTKLGKVSELLDRLFPRRICNRQGHDWIGFNSMGPHGDEGGGVFYAMRYRIGCCRCLSALENVPKEEWPVKDGWTDKRFAKQPQEEGEGDGKEAQAAACGRPAGWP